MRRSEIDYRVAHFDRARVLFAPRQGDLAARTYEMFLDGLARTLAFLGLADEFPFANVILAPNRAEFDRFVAHLTTMPTGAVHTDSLDGPVTTNDPPTVAITWPTEDLEVSGVELAPFLIVSRADEGEVGDGGIEVADYPGLRLSVTPYEAHTCSRCWRRVDDPVDDPELPDLCTRCHEVVRRLLEEGRTELGEAKA